MKAILTAAIAFLTAACATTGATYKSGVGDRFLEHPPWYAGAQSAAPSRIAHLPVLYQRGASQASFLDPASGAGTPTGALIAEMSAWLDSLGLTRPSARGTTVAGTPPDVIFGCEQRGGDECEEREEEVLGRQNATMRLAVGRPSMEWIAAARTALDEAGADHALVITLEIGQYWTRQTGLRGAKSVELGTQHIMPLPWLTSLEAPVSVLQLTGALVDREGKAVRIGAEGILARRTSLMGSAVGLQRVLRDEDIEQARSLKRDDLPGQPLAWQVALRHLVEQLTGGRP